MADVFTWNRNAIDRADEYNSSMKIWERSTTAGIRQWDNYMNDDEYIFLAIQIQVEPSLWDKTKDDGRFSAVQASKCPIELLILLKDRCTGTISGV